jgi:hypothetical protein
VVTLPALHVIARALQLATAISSVAHDVPRLGSKQRQDVLSTVAQHTPPPGKGSHALAGEVDVGGT